ncbi:hypothetical protein LEP1GSC082_3113 [Leptospira kirschneri str. H2]|uniref:Uncharacterized protein n=2 Tax=Leptospira kirschneri TaxID=29507 RepID=A0A0E2BFQ9_9LEPT|nr:hypothetical protein LEP1GSC081_3679 [Leptospira kirschneri str. H1]EKO51167.1 hypothetical protein LEP1GSC131_2910 [Leptospira kirschneri str. 200802841]EKO60369.1 hypothetical protein LEP1GSC082_3113 [Leptospira kirschneri str. H2]EMJ85368.1 hypothetical protein LEP1GSC198_0015 [Leptospira kirschneri str. JB]EMK09987.1 hypothetical protein LEP1GSC166_2983 [Leptospira kirschneri]
MSHLKNFSFFILQSKNVLFLKFSFLFVFKPEILFHKLLFCIDFFV